ncbi:hypothetical protein ACLMJK_009522 [Lecanora helva]
METSTNDTPLPPIRACIFDVDGLLINSEDIYTEIYNDILHSYNKPSLPWSIKAKQQSRGREVINDSFVLLFSPIDIDELSRNQQGAQKILDWAHLPLTVEEWSAQCSAQYERFKNCKPLPGVLNLLHTLSTKTSPTVHLAIASSATQKSFALKTDHLPHLTSYIPNEYRVFGDDRAMSDARKKPAPDVFLLALERVNAQPGQDERPIEVKECLVFEDSVAGVEAGRRAGMRVCWVPHRGLREVYRGRERRVLQGGSGDEDVHGSLGEGVEDGEVRRVERILSDDGGAEMIMSLEEFDYGYYGIKMRQD